MQEREVMGLLRPASGCSSRAASSCIVILAVSLLMISACSGVQGADQGQSGLQQSTAQDPTTAGGPQPLQQSAQSAVGAMQQTTTSHSQRVAEAMLEAARHGQVWAPLANLTWDLSAGGELGASAESMRQVVECINEKYVRKNMTWDAAMSDDLASVQVAGAWWTAKRRRVPVTLVTQSTVDRIPQLYAQCKSWGGPMAVVLYLGLQQNTTGELTAENTEQLSRAISNVASFFDDVERDPYACMPDILFVYEVYTEHKAMLLYPINLLRNLARLQARTPVVALVDVDMLLSSQVYEQFLDATASQRIVEGARTKHAYVLPAFETYGLHYEAAALADLLVTHDKNFLIDAVNRGIAAPFDAKRFIYGHNATNYAKWYRTNTDYEIDYGERYEPWVIVDRHAAPWHDVRFRGYGNNKIQHIAHINASDFQFVVLANAFIIHRAHKETSVRLRLVASKAAYDQAKAMHQPVDTTSVYGHTKTLFDNAKELMNRGRFKETLDPATTNCRAKLPWWQKTSSSSQAAEQARRQASTQGARRMLTQRFAQGRHTS